MKVFNNYADYYDTIYQDKNYNEECNFLEKIFNRYSKIDVKSILDLGCGTGGHSLILAKRGYSVTGVDISKKMLEIAKKKAKHNNLTIEFVQRDIRKLDLRRKFDVVISMFAVISYQTTNKDLIDTFNSVSRHLKRGGVFIFDFWFGPAVLSIKPTKRIKKFNSNDKKIVRYVVPELDIMNHTVTTHYTVIDKNKSKKINESHTVRYLFPQEIKLFAEESGLKVVRFCPFLNLIKRPTLKDWNVTSIITKK